jgi:hypothetical protein
MTIRCEACEFFKERGYYPKQTHHCRTCHRSWTGYTQAHCASCHSHFSTPSAFDRHMTDAGCRQPEELRNKDGSYVLGLRVDKWGRTWSFAGDGTPWWLSQHEMPSEQPEALAPSARAPEEIA